jgi:DNA repair protein RadC
MHAQDSGPRLIPTRDEGPQEFVAEALTDGALLGLITGNNEAAAQQLLAAQGPLKALCREDFSVLLERRMLGPVGARRLLAAVELGRRLQRTGDPRPRLATPGDIFRHLAPLLCGLRREVFHVLCLNSRNVLLRDACVAEGTADACLVDPREVFSAALISRASAVVLAHNHPSGDATPSSADVALTRQLVQAGQVLGIKVLDHLILGDGTYSSFLETGLLSSSR